MPDVKAWGVNRNTYYDTDFVDADFDTYRASDEEMAKEEEAEALALQKRLVEQMDDQDFGIDIFKASAKGMPEEKEEKNKEAQVIERDLTNMSKQEKLEVLKMESPELLSMIEDFRAKLLLIRDKIRPLVDLVEKGEIPIGPGTDYLHVKYELLLNYCTNVCFYLMMKAERTRTNNHPIIKRLVFYRNLLKELEPIDREMEGDMETILDCLNAGNDVSTVVKRIDKQEQVQKNPVGKKRKLKAMINWQQTSSFEPNDDSKYVNDLDTAIREMKTKQEQQQKKKKLEHSHDELKALHLYSLMKEGRKRNKVVSQSEDFTKDFDGSDSGDETKEIAETSQADEVEKRAITEKIAKNKGLKKYRKKLDRNPRVKNKLKYRRAKIRRKGQVSEVRKEVKKYSGEISGIKATTSRSIKIK